MWDFIVLVSPGFQAEEFRIMKNLENYVDICMNLN